MTKTITLQYVNDVKPGKKQGSVKTVDGEYYGIPAMTVKLFQPGKTYEVEYTSRVWEGKTFHTITNFQERDGSAAAPQSSGTPSPACTNTQDDRSHRIERQHSQEMAIRFCALQGGFPAGEGSDTEKLRTLIDWFARDIGYVPSEPSTESTDEPQPEEPF